MEPIACRGTNKRGEPCSAPVQGGNEWCYFHDPAKRAERRAAKARGGRARHGRKVHVPGGETVTLRTVDDVLTYLEQIAANLALLENSVKRARAQTYVAQQALTVLVEHEMEVRLEALEAERE